LNGEEWSVILTELYSIWNLKASIDVSKIIPFLLVTEIGTFGKYDKEQ
jgi:hypothetical protein